MKQKAVIHDHAAASMAEVEQAALDRGIKADIGLRDTELECAKYRRVMALEAEVSVWKLRYERMKASYNAVSVERDNLCEEKEAMMLGLNVSNERLQKDLQIMSASWKAVSVERDKLEDDLKAVKHSNTLLFKQNLDLKGGIESSKEQVASLHDQLEKADIAYTTLHKDASYAKYVARACCIASLLIVLQAAFVAFGGAV